MKFLKNAWTWFRTKEPAIVVGVGGVIAVAIEQSATGGTAISWKTLLPLLVAAVIRQLVTPAVDPAAGE